MTLRTFSSGGGVQSTAALVLSAQGRIDFPVHLFANVGDDSEHPATLSYVREVAMPYAAAHGIEFHELRRVWRDGSERTLLQSLERPSRTIDIPVRMANGAPGRRQCSKAFKSQVVARWTKRAGATPEKPAAVGIGFSTDEIDRVGVAPRAAWETATYPLLDLGLSRTDCHRVIADAGLPTPPKSSCWFCPMHRPAKWAEMRRDEPELFWRSVELERLLNERRDTLGKDHVYFTRFARPLDEAIGEAQPALFDASAGEWDGETCDEGVCFV